jgi:cullin-4
MIAAHLTTLVERSFTSLMEQGRTDDLQRLYSLAGRVGRVDALRVAFGAYVRSKAKAIVGDKDDEEKDKLMVASLISLRDEMERCVVQAWPTSNSIRARARHSPSLSLSPHFLSCISSPASRRLVAACFKSSESFVSTLKSGVESAVNSREDRPAELVARYLDGKLRAGAKATGTEADLELELDKIMVLFRSLHGKDVFEAFFKKDLAKRLLLGRSASIDLEKSLVSRLKTECGSQFTAKLEGMFKDIDLARELGAQFEASKHAAETGGIDVTVHVLTASNWPTYTYMPALLPAELERASKAFESFYSTKYSGNRRLQWQHNLGHCLLKASFPAGRKELDVSLTQAIVLLLFNTAEEIPFRRLKEDTGLEDAELRRTLQSLACGQVRVLRKEPKGRDVLDDDVFHFNASFTAALMRVKINQIQMKETKQEVDATNERVAQDRQYQMDAALVRIMKSRKTLTQQALLAELFAQLRFSAKAADVNKRIESLIEREYMERDEGEPNTFHYVA